VTVGRAREGGHLHEAEKCHEDGTQATQHAKAAEAGIDQTAHPEAR
jgi:hypothetical protein